MAGWLMYGLLYIAFHTMIKLGWWRWRIEGLEHLPPRQVGGIIFAMNHVHWLDIPIVATLLPLSYRLSWLGKSELFEHPLSAWWMRNMNVVPIRRGKRDLSALTASENVLRAGGTLLVFPEGHRSGTGILQSGNSGAIRLAARTGAVVVPIAMSGTQHGVRGTLTGEEVRLRIGQPYTIVPPENGKIPPAAMKELIGDMMQRIANMLPAAYRGHYQQVQHPETAVASGASHRGEAV